MEQTLNILVPLIFGTIFGIFGFFRLKRYRRLKLNGTKAIATITDFVIKEVDEDEFSGTFYLPVLEFKDSDGNTIKQQYHSSTSRKNLLKQVTIYYQKIDEEYEIMIYRKGRNYYVSILFIIISLGLLAVSLNEIINS